MITNNGLKGGSILCVNWAWKCGLTDNELKEGGLYPLGELGEGKLPTFALASNLTTVILNIFEPVKCYWKYFYYLNTYKNSNGMSIYVFRGSFARVAASDITVTYIPVNDI